MSTDTSIDLAIGGVVMPFLIAAVNQSYWNAKLKGAIAFLLCLGAAALLAALHGTLTLAQWRDTAIVVTGAALVMYHSLWKPSGIAPAVEDTTTIGGPSDPSDTADSP
jgi:ribose/xylose/arabinose/galactoside ABC-type transport system permease subunit